MRSSRSRRNPAHASYGRWLFGLNFPANDPIIELAATWVRGEEAPTQMLRLAFLSAERWTEAKDKRMRQAGKSVANKLKGWLEDQERSAFRHAPNTLASGRRYLNPRRRRNPNKGDKARHIRLAMMEVTNGWDYDLVSAEDSISDYEAEHNVSFTADEKAYIMVNAKPGSHMEVRGNPRRLRTRRNCCNPLPYEHSARLIDPDDVIRSTYRRKNVKGGTIGLLFAKLSHSGPMKLASVHFRAAHFTPSQARSWMRDHRLKPILFEAATAGRKAAWGQESVRAKRSAARGRKVRSGGRKFRQRRRVA